MKNRSRKPLLRPRNLVLLALVIFLGWFGIVVYRTWNLRPNIAVDYVAELRRLEESHRRPGADAWPAMKALAELLAMVDAQVGPRFAVQLEPHDGQFRWEWLVTAPYDEMTIEPEVTARSWLVDSGCRLLIQKISESSYASPPLEAEPFSSLAGMFMAGLSEGRSLARFLAADAYLSVRDGREQEYIQSVEAIVAIAECLGSKPSALSLLSGMGIEQKAYGRVRSDLGEADLLPETCSALLDIIDRRRMPDIALHLEGERMHFRDVVQRVYSDDGRGDGMLIVSHAALLLRDNGYVGRMLGQVGGVGNLAGPLYPSRAEAIQAFDEVIDHMIARSRLPQQDRAGYPFDLGSYLETLSDRWFLNALFLAGLDRTEEHMDRLAAERHATRLLLALEIHHARHGQWPATLSDLAPSVLPEIPIDPLNGKSFGYALREPTADDPRPFLLYSFGLDGTDDGGRPHGDQWGDRQPVQDESVTGYDYVYNRPRDVWDE